MERSGVYRGTMTIRHGYLRSTVLCFALLGCGSAVVGPTSDTGAEPAGSLGGTAEDGGDDGSSTDEPAASVGQAGAFEVQPVSFSAEPEGCRLNTVASSWTWEIGDPEQDAWVLIERVLVDGQVREARYDCARTGSAFSCSYEVVVDHGAFGQDAVVHLESTYDGEWVDADALSTDFHLQFTCEGAACANVAQHWTVTAFPCVNEGSVRGSRK